MSLPLEIRPLIVLAVLAIGYVLLMRLDPVRSSFRDGFRCIRRYRRIWVVLGIFGFAYASFQLGLRAFFYAILPPAHAPVFSWCSGWVAPEWREILRDSKLTTVQSIADIFNSLVPTFPLSSFAALLLFINFDGHHAVLNRALRRRFGAPGWLVYFAILVCALAAMVKPGLYVVLSRSQYLSLDPSHLLQVSVLIDWLAFLFEYLLGVYVQVYLILVVFFWIRGLQFENSALLDFAIRRFSFVVKWASVVLVLSSLLIHAPLVMSYFRAGDPEGTYGVFEYLPVAYWSIATFLLIFATMQVTLTFHNESILKAFGDHFRFIRHHGTGMLWFIVIAGIHLLLLQMLKLAIERGFGEGSSISLAWGLIHPWVRGIVTGWLLASWVCLFKRCEANKEHLEDWIKY